MTVYVSATAILPNEGYFFAEQISLAEAKALANKNKFVSCVGHESSAQVLTELLEVNVPMNRLSISLEPGDTMIVFKLNSRPAEGSILNRQQLEKIGFSFMIICCHSWSDCVNDQMGWRY
jgi:phosphohistidine phosphatase SixA